MALNSRTLRFDRGGILVEGANAKRFVYPRIDQTRFSSPLLNERNYELSGGGGWRDLIDRVVSGRKPVAFLNSAETRHFATSTAKPEGHVDAMWEAARLALDAGRCVLVHCRPGKRDVDDVTVFCAASIAGRIGDVFDLEALLADYQQYTRPAGPEPAQLIEAELDDIAPLDVSDFLNFTALEGEWGVPASPGDWARRGLLFGYPVETTAAIICEEVGIAGCGSWYLD